MDSRPERRPSLREQQKRQTRATILDAAAELIGQRGFRETTIDDIAKAVGASRATLYSYFPSKDMIVREIVIEMWDRAESLYRDFGALEEWSRASIGGWVEHVVATWEHSRDRLRVQSSGLVRYDEFYLDYHHRFVTALTANAAQWQRFDDADVQTRALLLISGLELFLNTWLVRGWPADRAGAIDTITDVWCAALLVD
ncbi:TetR/AcrR family transcriptional regulator [Saccharopolyspora shandongensis]|uniref:TetR/AcrR family transcriptional regulator n=1 Tax=Saccharopolyspora shandongensis TaxID=418495 RepID=UPI0033ED8EC0